MTTGLFIDTASQVCGWCIATDGKVRDAGLTKASPQRGTVLQRALSLSEQLAELIDKNDIDVVVMEVPGKRPPRHQRGMATRGQANYGFACGVIWSQLQAWFEPDEVMVVPADAWTRTAKAKRTAFVQAICPQYDPAQDPGLDVADAIGIMHWYLTTGGRYGEWDAE